jgi:hypothetical protein
MPNGDGPQKDPIEADRIGILLIVVAGLILGCALALAFVLLVTAQGR